MSSFLQRAASYMDDACAKKSIRLKILHIAFGHSAILCLMIFMAACFLHKVVADKMTAAESTKHLISSLGCINSISSTAFWMVGRPGLCLIFTHLACAAQILEGISSPAEKKSLQKNMERVEKRGRLPFYAMWILTAMILLGSVMNSDFVTQIYILEGIPHWSHMMIEFVFVTVCIGFGLPATFTAVLTTLLASKTIIEFLNDGLRRCRGNEELLKKLIQVHQEVLTALMIARSLFQYVLLSGALVWCTALLLSFFNILSGCYSPAALSLLPIGSAVITSACEAGDIIVRNSVSASGAVIYSGWENAGASFRQEVLMFLRISQRPAYLKIYFSGMLCRKRMKVFRAMYSAFTLMLSVFDASTCKA